MRNVPVVALDADPATGYYVYSSGWTAGGAAKWGTVGGTSAAAPLWAGYWSLIAKGYGASTGFANTTLYTIGKNSTEYARDFHDVTSGNNAYYNAVAGYDNSTGLGSFN